MRVGSKWNENEERRSRHLHCGKHTAGERATCCGNMNPNTAFGFQGVKLQPPSAVFSHYAKNVFYIGTFCWIKQSLSQMIFLSVLMTQIVWETISFAKHLPTLSLFHEFCWPSGRRFTRQLMGFSRVSMKGCGSRQALQLFSGATAAIYLIFLSISSLQCMVRVTLLTSMLHHKH